jgi:hypothetical protein
MEITRKVPKHVELSPRLKEKAAFYIRIMSLGIPYYIAATPVVQRLLTLDKDGKDAKPDLRLRWDSYKKEDALRDIVSSLELQVRDVVLAGIESNVTDALLARMAEVMSPTVRAKIQAAANTTDAQQLLEAGKCQTLP